MAGSYRHITNSANEFMGIDLIDNLGDAYEALEECYQIIKELGGTKKKIYKAECHIYKKKFGKKSIFPFSFKEYWHENENKEN